MEWKRAMKGYVGRLEKVSENSLLKAAKHKKGNID